MPQTEWQKNNPDKVRAANKRWREKNRDKVRAACRRYYRRNAEKLRAASVAYYHDVVKVSPEAVERVRLGKLRWYNSPAGQAWFSRWRRKNKKRQAEHNRNWELKNPEKHRAHKLVSYAVKTGKLVRVPCACGSPKSEAHHDDYSRPLDVKWLCRPCHKKEHAAENNIS